eukprot:c17030_g1_i1.p1 GENE.c17030_g1_i1~~c17030_g1_i1.p1  ORF type:complete len:1122 (-),score=289.03 c17030_g1_i1:48-3413(-)
MLKGNLVKEGKYFSVWRQRWFEIWDDRLIYFPNSEALNILGWIKLDSIMEIDAVLERHAPSCEGKHAPELSRPKKAIDSVSALDIHGQPKSRQKPSQSMPDMPSAGISSTPVLSGVKEEDDNEPEQSDLEGAFKAMAMANSNNVFFIQTSSRVFQFRALDTQDMRNWIDAIRAQQQKYMRGLERTRRRKDLVNLIENQLEKTDPEALMGQHLSIIQEEQQARLLLSEDMTRLTWSDNTSDHPRYLATSKQNYPSTKRIASIRPNLKLGESSITTTAIQFQEDELLSSVIGKAVNKFKKMRILDANAVDSDFIFKVTGKADFLYGPESQYFMDFEHVRDSVEHHKPPDLVLFEIGGAKLSELVTNAQSRPHFNDSELIAELNESRMVANLHKINTSHTGIILSSSIKRPFHYTLHSAWQLPLDSTHFCTRGEADTHLCCRVRSSLALGNEQLSEVWTDPFSARPSFDFNQAVVTFPNMRYCDLPRGTKLCITLYGGSSASKVTEPLGWVNIQLFDHTGLLKSGSTTLKMWPNNAANHLATCQQNVEYSTSEPPPSLQIAFLTLDKPVVWDWPATSVDRQKVKSLADGAGAGALLTELDKLGKHDMLYELTPKDKELLWTQRDLVAQNSNLLPKLVRSVDWTKRDDVNELKQLFESDSLCLDTDACMELLDATSAEEFVRSAAVRFLVNMPDTELEQILPQLTHAIKHEAYHSSDLARFLFARALKSPDRIGHPFFWNLKAEVNNESIRERYSVLLWAYLTRLPSFLRTQFIQQSRLIQHLCRVAEIVKTLKRGQRTNTLQTYLKDMSQLLPQTFALPIEGRLLSTGLEISRCRCMNSATVPLFLVFKNQDPLGRPVHIIFKSGDDLRQDILTLQIFQVMDRIWIESNLDLNMTLYKCIAVDSDVGIIEVVQDAETVGNILRSSKQGKLAGALAAFKHAPLLDWLRERNPDDNDFNHARQNFSRSCAGYCVATYVLGIGDRHNDNVMVTHTGCLFHIDFGHFLGNFQKFLGLNRDRAPFVFTPDFAYVLGGKDSPGFKEFVRYCKRALLLLRHHSRRIVNLLGLMMSTGIPELQTPADLHFLKTTLMQDLTDAEAETKFEKLIYESLNATSTQVNNAIHILAN